MKSGVAGGTAFAILVHAGVAKGRVGFSRFAAPLAAMIANLAQPPPKNSVDFELREFVADFFWHELVFHV